MLIALCSDKGSPGVTTTALALGSAWATAAVVVEADLAGGDLAIRLRPNGAALPEAPTLLTAASAARTQVEPDTVSNLAHTLSSRVAVVPAPIGHEQMAGVGDWQPLADALGNSVSPILADLGRLHANSRVTSIAARADMVILVGRPDATSVIRMRDRLTRLAAELAAVRGKPARFFPVLVTPRRHGEGSVGDLRAVLASTAARPFIVGLGHLALDPPAVRRLEAGDNPAGRLARSDLLRTAHVLAARVEAAASSTPRSATAASAGGMHA